MLIEEETDGLHDLLCVAVESNPSRGFYFSDPGIQSEATFGTAVGTPGSSFFEVPVGVGGRARWALPDAPVSTYRAP